MSNITSDYSFWSIAKQGACNKEIFQTALEWSKNFTHDDIVILWAKSNKSNVKNRIFEQSEHTQTVIISEPYRYDILNINLVIYETNLNLVVTDTQELDYLEAIIHYEGKTTGQMAIY